MSASYGFLLGDILWWIGPWVFVFFSRVRGLFVISGVWIFEFCFAFVVMSARPMIFLLQDILWWIDPWVFVVSSCVQGLFAISGVWIFEFWFAFVLNERTRRALWFFCVGTFCDELTLGSLWFLLVFGVFSRYPAFVFLSFSSQFVLRSARPMIFFAWGHFVMNRPLGCCGFFLRSGSFTISGVWIFESCFAICC